MKLGIISDIHEDIISLEIAFIELEKAGCDEVVCLGDISGFSIHYAPYFHKRNAHECLALVKANCKHIVMGNHDLNAAKRIPGIHPEFEYPQDWFELDYPTKKKLANGKLWLYDKDELNPLYHKEDIEFLRQLPEFAILEAGNMKLLLSHYLFPNITGSGNDFFYDAEAFIAHAHFTKQHDATHSIIGHAHAQGITVACKNKIIRSGFRKKQLPHDFKCIVAPPIVHTKRKNGFLIFDTESYILHAKRV